MKTKISEEHEVEREIKVEMQGSNFIIKDTFLNIIRKKTPMEFMDYYNHIAQNNSAKMRSAGDMHRQLDMIYMDIDQNDQLLKEMKSMYSKARALHMIDVKKKERAGKADGAG